MVEAAEEAARKNLCGLHLRPLGRWFELSQGEKQPLGARIESVPLNLKDNLVPCYEGLKSEKKPRVLFFKYIPTKKEKRTPKVHVKDWVVQKGLS